MNETPNYDPEELRHGIAVLESKIRPKEFWVKSVQMLADHQYTLEILEAEVKERANPTSKIAGQLKVVAECRRTERLCSCNLMLLEIGEMRAQQHAFAKILENQEKLVQVPDAGLVSL